MPTVIDALIVTLGLDPSSFEEGRKKVAGEFLKLKEQSIGTAKEVSGQGKKSAEFFSVLRREVAGLLTSFLSLRAIQQFTDKVIQSDRATKALSTTLNTAVEELGQWKTAAELAGYSGNAIVQGWKNINEQYAKWKEDRTNVPPALQALASLNVFMMENGKDLTMTQFYTRVTEAIAKMGLSAAQATERLKAIGIPEEAIPFILSGIDKVRAALQKAKDVGYPTQAQIDRSVEFGNKLKVIQGYADSIAREFEYRWQGNLMGVLTWIEGIEAKFKALPASSKAFYTDLAVGLATVVPVATLLFGPAGLLVSVLGVAAVAAADAFGLSVDGIGAALKEWAPEFTNTKNALSNLEGTAKQVALAMKDAASAQFQPLLTSLRELLTSFDRLLGELNTVVPSQFTVAHAFELATTGGIQALIAAIKSLTSVMDLLSAALRGDVDGIVKASKDILSAVNDLAEIIVNLNPLNWPTYLAKKAAGAAAHATEDKKKEVSEIALNLNPLNLPAYLAKKAAELVAARVAGATSKNPPPSIEPSVVPREYLQPPLAAPPAAPPAAPTPDTRGRALIDASVPPPVAPPPTTPEDWGRKTWWDKTKSIFGFAEGGDAEQGKPFVVGEKGREVLQIGGPLAAGRITPMGAWGQRTVSSAAIMARVSSVMHDMGRAANDTTKAIDDLTTLLSPVPRTLQQMYEIWLDLKEDTFRSMQMSLQRISTLIADIDMVMGGIESGLPGSYDKSGDIDQGGPASAAGINPASREQLVKDRDFLMSLGHTFAEANAIVANENRESGGDINARGDYDPRTKTYRSQGLFQWDKQRREIFKMVYGYDMMDRSIDPTKRRQDMLRYVGYEMTHHEAKAGRLFKAAPDAAKDAVFTREFERSLHQDRDIAKQRPFLRWLQSVMPGTTSPIPVLVTNADKIKPDVELRKPSVMWTAQPPARTEPNPVKQALDARNAWIRQAPPRQKQDWMLDPVRAGGAPVSALWQASSNDNRRWHNIQNTNNIQTTIGQVNTNATDAETFAQSLRGYMPRSWIGGNADSGLQG